MTGNTPSKLTKYNNNSALANKNAAIEFAKETEILPLAKGLFFFFGCSLSNSISFKSLKIYTELAVKLKTKNIMIDL